MTRPTQKEVEQARIRAVCGMIYNKDGPDEVFRAWIVRVYDAYLELEAELGAGQFWREILREVPGDHHENIKQELMDFYFLMDQVPKVYMHITGGRLSKVMYYADVVIAQADECEEEHTQEAIKDALEEALEPLEAENAAIKSLLADFHARMMDTYDGTCDSVNRMPFTGSDLYELERALR